MKTKYIFLTILVVISLSSCKDFLNTEPTDFLSPVTYYETAEQLEFARAGVYDVLGDGSLYGTSGNYLFAWEADIGYMNRSTLTTGPWNYNFSTSDGYATNFWANLYRGINRANVLLENLDKIRISIRLSGIRSEEKPSSYVVIFISCWSKRTGMSHC